MNRLRLHPSIQVLLIIVVFSLFIQATPTFAESVFQKTQWIQSPDRIPDPPSLPPPAGDDNNERLKQSSAGIGFSIRQIKMSSERYQSALTNNGFDGFRSSGITWGFHFYFAGSEGWRLGFGTFDHVNKDDSGQDYLGFQHGYTAISLAKDFLPQSAYSLVIGSYLGGGESEIDVLSGNQDAKFREEYFILEPFVQFEFPISRLFAIGIFGSYWNPVGEKIIKHGDDLGIQAIAKAAWTFGLNFTFGWFGEHSRRNQQLL